MLFKIYFLKTVKRRVLPTLLALFIFSFNLLEVYSINFENQFITINNLIEVRIDKNTSDTQLLNIKTQLANENFDFSYTLIRNKNDEIKNIAIEISGKNQKQGEVSSRYNSVSDNDTINPINIVIDTSIHSISINNADASNTAANSIIPKTDPNKQVSITTSTSADFDFKISEAAGNDFIFITNDSQKEPLFYIDGVKSDSETVKNLDESTIESMNVLKGVSATQKYGDKATYGVIEIITKK